MCLIVVGWHAHPDYPLIVAANRDEFFARPSAPAHWWTDLPHLLAGRDLEAGGTWMGLTRRGRFAALTNYRDPSARRPDAPSRGALVRDALLSGADAVTTLRDIAQRAGDYAGFNLFVGDGRTLAILESTRSRVTPLKPGIYGLSNHLLDTPWPKVALARERFAKAIRTLPDESALLALLRDDTPAADAHLPDTGISPEWERWLSPAFIRAPGYGTRASTLALLKNDGTMRLREWSWDDVGQASSESIHYFKLADRG